MYTCLFDWPHCLASFRKMHSLYMYCCPFVVQDVTEVSFSTSGDFHGSSLQAVPQPLSAPANGHGFPGNCVDPMADNKHGGHLANMGGDVSNGLRFEDMAENAGDVSSEMDHHTSVKAEEHYDHMLYSTMLLYHGC